MMKTWDMITVLAHAGVCSGFLSNLNPAIQPVTPDDSSLLRMTGWDDFGKRLRWRLHGWMSQPGTGCVLAIVFVSLAALLRWTLPGVLARTPFLAFYPAVVAAAMLGGFGPGMVATAVSALCYMLWFAPDPDGFHVRDPVEWMRIGIFVAGGAGVSLLARMLRRAQQSERRQAQELRVSNERHRVAAEQLQAIMEAVPGGICVAHDPLCRQITGNLQARDLLGVPPGENAWVTPEDLDATVVPHFRLYRHGREMRGDEMPMQIAGRTGSTVRDAECEVVRRDGTRRTVLANAAPLRSSDGVVWGVVGAFTDITDRKRAEEALRQSREDLNRAAGRGANGELAAGLGAKRTALVG